MAERRTWPALVVRAPDAAGELIAAVLDDFSPAAIEDLTPQPLPPGGLWDPTCPPPPEPPPGPLHWRVFFATATDRDAARIHLGRLRRDVAIESEDVPDEDWAARSQRQLTAITAGSFIVAPPWAIPAPVPDGATLIVIEPSRGFGTGHHASTRLCLRALSEIDVAGRRVLDVGTGSGVLAMAAAMKGAGDVVAVDVDPDAIESARASAALNPAVQHVKWLVGDFRDPGWVAAHGGPWPIVLANLTGGMLIASAARVRELIAPGGTLVASGFDERERAGVLRALALVERAGWSEDGWMGARLERGAEP